MPSPGGTEATGGEALLHDEAVTGEAGGPAGAWFGVPEPVTEPGLAEEGPAEMESAEAAAPGTGALQNPTAAFYAWDHLGTIRLVFSADRSVIERHDYEPYGVELRPILNQTGNTHQFTGHERDLASGYDYMHFQYYGSNMGRFVKPDDGSDQSPTNPKSWNLYGYVHGNPVNFNDPTGHQAASPDDTIPSDPSGNIFWGGDSSKKQLLSGQLDKQVARLLAQLAAANIHVSQAFVKALQTSFSLQKGLSQFMQTKVGQELLRRTASDKNTNYSLTVGSASSGSVVAPQENRGYTDFDPAKGFATTAAGVKDANAVTTVINVDFIEKQYSLDKSGNYATRAIAETIGHELIRADIMGGGRYTNQPERQLQLDAQNYPLEQKYLEELSKLAH